MYYLVWNREVIEDDIATKEEAIYLQQEYTLAYGGVVVIKKHRVRTQNHGNLQNTKQAGGTSPKQLRGLYCGVHCYG